MGALLLMLALAGAAPAPATGASSFCPGRGLVNPRWIARPTGDEMMEYYPSRIFGRDGRAVMDCVVRADGRLGGCTIAMEDPPGVGFGAAALRLAPRFRLDVQTPQDRKAVGQHVCIPIHWVTDNGAPATSEAPPPPPLPAPQPH